MGARLDNGIEIAVVTEMVHDIDVQLMITALTGIIRDKGGIIRSVRGDVLIRAVNGNAVITFEFGADGDSLIEATQEFGEGFFCEFAALMDESGFGRAVWRANQKLAISPSSEEVCMLMVSRMVSSKGKRLLRVKSLPGFMTNSSGCCFMSEMVSISFLRMMLGVKMGFMCEDLLKVVAANSAHPL